MVSTEATSPLVSPSQDQNKTQGSWEIRWTTRPKKTRMPFGYLDNSDGTISPDPEVIPLLDEALNNLDNGESLRNTTDWLKSKGLNLTFMGLRLIWDKERPDHPRKVVHKANRTKLTLEEKLRQRQKKKIAQDKKRVAAAEKRIQKGEEVLSNVRKQEQDAKSSIFEGPVTEYQSIPEDDLIAFKAHEGPQEHFLAAEEQQVLYGGAAGGGKSYALLADPMRYFENPKFRGLLVRRTNDELRELIDKSRDLYKTFLPKATFHEQKSEWRFPSGAKMWFAYLEKDEDVRRYQGQAFSWIGFDELTQYPTSYPWTYLSSRLRSDDPFLSATRSMRATSNPGGPGHGWVKKMFIDPAPENTPFPARDLETGKDLVYPDSHELAGQPLYYRKFIPAKVSDNPSLWADGQYEATLLGLPEAQRKQLLEGNWDIADGAAFPEFNRSIHTCKPFRIPDSWRRYRSCDYGYSSFSAVHWYAIDPDGQLIVYRELYVTKYTGTDLGYRILREEAGEDIAFGVLDSSVWAMRGTTGPSVAEEILGTGCRFRPSDRSKGSRSDGLVALHKLLEVDERGKPGIIFFDTCRQIITDLPILPSAKDGSDDIDIKYTSDHAYDSIRYGIQARPRRMGLFDYPARERQDWRPSDARFGY